MTWILINQDSLEKVESASSWTRSQAIKALLGESRIGAGYLLSAWDDELDKHHHRLSLNFRAGWDAVAWAVRSSQKELGSFAPPTCPGPRPEAPFGCYLLSLVRLERSLLAAGEHARSPQQWAADVHALQGSLGPVFLDPRIELELSRPVEGLQHREQTTAGRLKGALGLLLEGPRS